TRTFDGARDSRRVGEREGRRLHQRAQAAADHDRQGPGHAHRGAARARLHGQATGRNHQAAVRGRCPAARVPRLGEPADATRVVGTPRLEERDRRNPTHARRTREETPMRALAWTLLHFLWQGAAIAALAGALMALFRGSSTRYLIGVGALALMFAS